MARIPTQVVDEIRNRTNIVEIIGQYVQLKKSGGKSYVGLCPFHNEKSPSFSVSEDKQFYHCFGCGRGGNVFRFIEEIEGLSFQAAVLRVAELEGIPVEEQFFTNVEELGGTSSTSQLIGLHEKAAEIYHHLLMHTTTGQAALDYLLERGLTEETIIEFQIGFAPVQREFLEKVFLNEKLPKELFAASGLFVEREDGQLLDRFYQRVVFPIRNAQGKTIGFSGRWLDLPEIASDNQAKYLNSPETEIFNKREVLFNFDKARSTIRKDSEVYLFEGFMDVLAAWQAGIRNGIASMGTSLTQQQIQIIEKIATSLVFSYDGDSAGIEATNRGIDLLKESSPLELSVLSFPERLDPDEYIRKYGQAAFVNLAHHGRETVFSFKQTYHRLNRNLSNEKEQLDYLEQLLKDLIDVDSLLEQDRYLTQLSTEFQVSREALQQQFRQLKQQKRTQRQHKQQTFIQEFSAPPSGMLIQNQPKSQVDKAQEILLYRLFHEEGFNQQFKNLAISFPKEHYQELYVLFDTYIAIETSFEVAKFFDFLQDEKLRYLVAQIENLKLPEESSEQELQDILRVIQNASIQEEIQQKKLEQQMASQMGNQQRELELAVEILNLTKHLKKIQ